MGTELDYGYAGWLGSIICRDGSAISKELKAGSGASLALLDWMRLRVSQSAILENA